MAGKRFLGKVAIVTGSSDGIGLGIARRLAEEGARVVVSSRKETNVRRAVDALRADGLSAEGVVCHVANAADRRRLIATALDKFGKIDILVSNAGINPAFSDILEVSEAVWDKLFEVNVKAGFLLCKELVPIMQKQGGGTILFVSSISAYSSAPGIEVYAVTKAALLRLVKALSESCAPKKIRVNGIAPGLIKTHMSKALWSSDGGDSHFGAIPLGRLGSTADCAAAAAFLCSDDAAYITGETIVVAGGVQSRL